MSRRPWPAWCVTVQGDGYSCAGLKTQLEETGLSPLSIHYLSSRPNRYPFSGITVYTADQFFLVEVEDCHKAVAQDDAAEIVITELGKLSAQDFGLESISHFMAEFLSGQIKLPY